MTPARLAMALVAVAHLLGGCEATEERVSPPPPAPTTTEPPPTSAPIRAVSRRDPFGDTLLAGNLFADGDFELTGRVDQMAWLVAGGGGQQTLRFDTGGRCFSGLRCAWIKPGETLVGQLVSPRAGQMSVSVRVSPRGKTCGVARVTFSNLDFRDGDVILKSQTDRPDDTGWCLFAGVVAARPAGEPILLVDALSIAPDGVLVDHAVALPVPAPAGGAGLRAVPAPADVQARAASIAAWIKARRRFGAPPGVPAGPP